MTRERILTGKPIGADDEAFQLTLRPRYLREYIGQEDLRAKLSISLEAARGRGEPLEHTLLHGPPGLGKTTLSYIIANEMEGRLFTSSGPALPRSGDLMGILTNLDTGDVLFIDEVHRLPTVVEEFIYPAMEEFKVDFVVDRGAFAKTINVPLKRFTLIGATTRAGFLSPALRARFGIIYHVDFYSIEEIEKILLRSAHLLDVSIEEKAVREIARRSRGTPRIANRLLRRVRDYAQVKADGRISLEVARSGLIMEGVDEEGLDELDRKLLRTIIDFYGGGPVGVEAISATLNEEVDTLVDMVEPHLLKEGFLRRTPKGRQASLRAYEHLGIERRNPGAQEELWR